MAVNNGMCNKWLIESKQVLFICSTAIVVEPVVRSLSPELQEDVVRVVANGNLLLKTAKPFMPSIAGLGPRSGLSQQQLAGLPAGLNSQVRYYKWVVFCNMSCSCSYLHLSAITCEAIFCSNRKVCETVTRLILIV